MPAHSAMMGGIGDHFDFFTQMELVDLSFGCMTWSHVFVGLRLENFVGFFGGRKFWVGTLVVVPAAGVEARSVCLGICNFSVLKNFVLMMFLHAGQVFQK